MGRAGSVAVLSSESVLRRVNLDSSSRTAATLTPELEQTFGWCRDHHHRLSYLSVASGPGSFTGLRIGVTTAKTLGYALKLPLVAVDSLAAVAAATFRDHPDCQSLLVAVNAYRGQVFCGSYRRETLLPPPESLDAESAAVAWRSHADSTSVCDAEQWLGMLADRGSETEIAGDAQPFGELGDRLLTRSCDAVGVGMIAVRAAICNGWEDPFTLKPRYLKPSAAEEKADS